MFNEGKGQRDISLSSSYIIHFKHPRDKTQIRFPSRQLAPENANFGEDAYRDATNNAHGYLMVDLNQNTDDMYHLKTNIFPAEYYICYVSKRGYKYSCNQQNTRIRLPGK